MILSCGIRKNVKQKESEVIPMYDELIKNLRLHADPDGNCARDTCPYYDEEACSAVLAKEAADAIERLDAIAQTYVETVHEIEDKRKWIPVTERLPDVFKHVLVNIPGMAPHPTVQEGFREKNGMWYLNGFRYEADDITHWMPLPQPPKDGES